MRRNDLPIEITLNGPLFTHSSEPGDFGLDSIIARKSDDTPYIPGTLLMGKLDQAWQEIADACKDKELFAPDAEQWLGRRSENNSPLRKQLFFSDLILSESLADDFIHHRITIDAQRGAAARQQLLAIESPFLQGKQYVFKGTISYFSPRRESEAIEHYIKAGMRWLTQLGAMRTIGYGRVQTVDFPVTEDKPLHSPEQSTDIPEKIGLKIKPEHPFCLAGTPTADNLFESTEIIPGSALLGSIMTTWNRLAGSQNGTGENIQDSGRKELQKYFNSLRISHAFPSAEENQRPVIFPKSLVTVIGDSAFYDVALCEKPCLIKGKVPAFSIDWKDGADVAAAFGWTPVPRELRIRTGIEPLRLRSAENELFSYEQVIPDNHYWYAELDLSEVPKAERSAVYAQLRSLTSQGICGLGKTKTPATVEFLIPPDTINRIRKSNPEPVNGNQWIVTLQTDTLLGSPETLDETSGMKALREMYSAAWQELSGNTLSLVRYFARQRLDGGIWRRTTMQKDHTYRPWLLTEAGSVFVLQATDDAVIPEAGAMIQKLLDKGLPVTAAARKYYFLGNDPNAYWRHCPYIPQNGFGEIAVNLDVHTANSPSKCTPIDLLEEEETVHDA